MTHFLGQTVRLRAAFTDTDGSAADPDSGTVYIAIYNPLRTNTVTKTTTGVSKVSGTTATYEYLYDLPAEGATNAEAGNWIHVWYGTTTVNSSEYDTVAAQEFEVKKITNP